MWSTVTRRCQNIGWDLFALPVPYTCPERMPEASVPRGARSLDLPIAPRRLIDEEQFDEACEVGKAAVYADIMGLESHLLFGKALEATGKRQRALFELETATLCPGPVALKAEAHARLAGAYAATGNHRAAAAEREKARALQTQLKSSGEATQPE